MRTFVSSKESSSSTNTLPCHSTLKTADRDRAVQQSITVSPSSLTYYYSHLQVLFNTPPFPRLSSSCRLAAVSLTSVLAKPDSPVGGGANPDSALRG